MLSMKAKYAIKAVMVLARNKRKLLPTKTIAKEADIPPKFLEAILVDLRNCGIVSSKRGILGGHTLAKAPDAITVGDIVRIIDGALAPIRCASVTDYAPCKDCPDEKKCAIRNIMQDVRLAISNVLDRRTIFDLLRFPKSIADKIIDD